MTDSHTPDTAPNGGRKRLFILLAAVVAALGGGWTLWWELWGSRWVSTDNAYTAAEIAQVAAATGGTIQQVLVTDTQTVKTGQLLVVIDDTDARLALAQAEAELGRAIRRVRGYVATDQGLAAQIAARGADKLRAEAQMASAEADLRRARIDLDRRRALAGSGSVSGEEVTKAESDYAMAEAALAAAKAAVGQAGASITASIGSRDANAALIDGSDLDANPEVALARAKRDQARVDLERTRITAPVDGVVARRSVQLGQRVQAGMPLLSVVPLAQLHVDANFKEGQLEKVATGQPVELTSDLYGGGVVFHGSVAGFSGGTGAVFAAIPAQNATGNWIKVVQRLPVRIALDPKELTDHPLQVGLSMDATIDVSRKAAP